MAKEPVKIGSHSSGEAEGSWC